MIGQYTIPPSEELQRIEAIPRRRIDVAAATQLAKDWTPQLLNERGLSELRRVNALSPTARAAELERMGLVGYPLELSWKQAIALLEFIRVGGLFLLAPVGTGKTLMSWLLALLAQWYFGITRVVVLVSGSGEQQTHSDYRKIAQLWKAPSPTPQTYTYQALGGPDNVFALCGCEVCANQPGYQHQGPQLRPELAIPDEFDFLKNPKASVTKRVVRYGDNHPTVRWAMMSGTGMRNSAKNFMHLIRLTHRHNPPVPINFADQEAWAGATDTNPRAGYNRPPGALLRLCAPEDLIAAAGDDTAAAQLGVGRRLEETEGVVIIKESSCNTPIKIRVLTPPRDNAIEQALLSFGTTSKRPDGYLIANPFEKIRFRRQVAHGFYTVWNPRPPQWWLAARAEWNELVAEEYEASVRRGQPLDSEGAVARKLADDPVYLAWCEAKRVLKPKTAAITVSLSVLTYAAEWIRVNGPALVWVSDNWVGDTLAAMTGVPFFHSKGKSAAGAHIDDHDPRYSAILSTQANKRQRNLQGWNRMLYLNPDYSSEKWEQSIGRAHRQGQKHSVLVDVLMSSGLGLIWLDKLRGEAAGVGRMTRLDQKVTKAEWDWSHVPSYCVDRESCGNDSGLLARWHAQ